MTTYRRPDLDRITLVLSLSLLSLSASGWLFLLHQFLSHLKNKHPVLELPEQ